MMGQDQDDVIYVPISSAQRNLFGRWLPGSVRQIMVKARSTEELERAEMQIKALLRQRHRIGPKEEDDFTVRNLHADDADGGRGISYVPSSCRNRQRVSLLVGGIGIMNIMLVSVTEKNA